MGWHFLLLLGAAAAAAVLVAVKLLARRRGDLTGPPRPGPRHLPPQELDELTEMVGRGEEAEVRRRLKDAGYDEAATRRLLWFMIRLAEPDGG